MLPVQKNTLLQGNIGLGEAISHFTLKGCIVSIPLNDIQDYDLVVDFGDCVLKKVQVKTTRFKEGGTYKVELKTAGKSFRHNQSDFLFVLDGSGKRYFIPKERVGGHNAINLGRNYERFIVS